MKRDMKKATVKRTMPAGVAKVLKRLHYPLDMILLCVRWYVAYPLSLRHLEEMMADMIRKGQMKDSGVTRTAAAQFYSLVT
jgi:transposase-like protein